MEARFFTDVGQFREQNEDAGGIYTNQTGQILLVICDGMGGHAAGEVASQFVNDSLRDRFEQENYIEYEQAEDWLKANLADINRQLYNESMSNDLYKGMGTTCVCVLIYEKDIVVANIGDSRAYLVNNREMMQLTNDHTFVNHLVSIGEITKEEAFTHPQKNIITKVMGTDKRVKADVFYYQTKYYDYLLLNSDGLTDYLHEDDVQKLIMTNDGTIEDIGFSLIDSTIEIEGKDNISFILCPFEGGKI
ncbi:Stp1/IreP family PP2C-type Ser/Thr phosphatase [Mammaliicoccus stepanovicii]|uniref:protein-serine/threonine phosphatase n=1 Tax=Mammaliicoccus stepanovicii TaxID=643214 RepID=A0A239ZIC2_9STAP|nr:Stp1/IreP family PP2C-type Ser/Thr phosphatase [Mammaliicoccus stepanovicii]PNZ77956.1 protein phosphatase [Mammaliicoccus stepanovicii]GGI41699.1 protein phosphatase [Mammaliicoccus stepanovicii]SNV71061.1 Protein serine/threonine phosphatase PrpC, regulation of stationary phase [Mammaliicoccus stepanovicii]